MTSEARLIKLGALEDSRYWDSPQTFDLKGHKEISQIFLTAGQKGITSIQFQYVENGKYVLSDLFGCCDYTKQFHTIELNHPAEYITGIKGLYSSASNSSYDNIQMITFTTNIQEYAPFGFITSINLQSEFINSKNFTYNLGKSCQFGGFHGTYRSTGLISLGFYLSVKTNPSKPALKIPKNEA